MRRFLAILLMLIIPLQLAWSSVAGVHGHLDGEIPVSGFHYHADDHDHHHDDGAADHDSFAGNGIHSDHDDDGYHGGHYHPVFSLLLIKPDLMLGAALPDGPPVRATIGFTSHIPPLFDRPPSAFLQRR